LFSVYILYSDRTARYYVGSTQDVSRRLREHNAGKSLSTRAGVPWRLLLAEDFATRSEAVRHEAKIKARGVARYLGDIQIAQPN
jgi:putative endonuclease